MKMLIMTMVPDRGPEDLDARVVLWDGLHGWIGACARSKVGRSVNFGPPLLRLRTKDLRQLRPRRDFLVTARRAPS